MNIKKGTKLYVNHSRKGKFYAYAEKDFNTNDEWFPIILSEKSFVQGMNPTTNWRSGERIPCRSSLCTLKAVV